MDILTKKDGVNDAILSQIGQLCVPDIWKTSHEQYRNMLAFFLTLECIANVAVHWFEFCLSVRTTILKVVSRKWVKYQF